MKMLGWLKKVFYSPVIFGSSSSTTSQNQEEEKSKVKILIDNGHGAGNRTVGKRSPYAMNGTKPALNFIEGDWNREIAGRIVSELRDLGYDAELVVPELEDISLKTRVTRVNNIAKKLGKENVILVSIHSNAAGNGSAWMKAYGWSGYTTKGTTKSDALADALYDAAEKYWNGWKRRIRVDNTDGDRDWEENFYIIYHTICPAVLTENGFYDNIEDCEYLLSESGKEDVTRIHISGIIEYLKSL